MEGNKTRLREHVKFLWRDVAINLKGLVSFVKVECVRNDTRVGRGRLLEGYGVLYKLICGHYIHVIITLLI